MKLCPKCVDGGILMPLAIMCVRWIVTAVSLAWFLGRQKMFENIPNIEMTAPIALGVVAMVAIVMCVSRFLENEKENANEKKLAKMNGTEYDTVNEELSRKFWCGYLIVAILGAIVSVALGIVVADAVFTMVHVVDETRLTLYTIAICALVWIVCDHTLFTRLGDNAYFSKIEKDAIETFLSPVDAETETVSEGEKTEGKLKLTREEKLALLEKIL